MHWWDVTHVHHGLIVMHIAHLTLGWGRVDRRWAGAWLVCFEIGRGGCRPARRRTQVDRCKWLNLHFYVHPASW